VRSCAGQRAIPLITENGKGKLEGEKRNSKLKYETRKSKCEIRKAVSGEFL